MSASESSRPNQVKYHARKVAATKSAARIRIGPEPGARTLSMGVKVIKHQVDNHTGHRHVQPQRQRESRDAPVAREVAAKSSIESQKDERDDHHGENSVTRQDREVER